MIKVTRRWIMLRLNHIVTAVPVTEAFYFRFITHHQCLFMFLRARPKVWRNKFTRFFR